MSTPTVDTADAAALLVRLRRLRETINRQAEQQLVNWRVEGGALSSGAGNLAAYLALRRHDIRELQQALTDLGVATLGLAQSHVVASLDAIIATLGRVEGEPLALGGVAAAKRAAQAERDRHTTALFGFPLGDRHTRIMVTLDARDVDDPERIEALVANGMDCARINCGHDGPAVWERLVGHVRDASRRTGRSCTVLMDLSGPRLRVGPIAPEPGVIRLRVRRDPTGRVLGRDRVVFDGRVPVGRPAHKHPDGRYEPAVVSVDPQWLSTLGAGGRIELVDGGGRRRSLTVLAREGEQVLAEATAGTYLLEGQRLVYRPPSRPGGHVTVVPGSADVEACRHPTTIGFPDGEVGPIEPRPGRVRVRVGDRVLLSRAAACGRAPELDSDGVVGVPGVITCEDPAVVDDLRVGHRVLVDEGAVELVVERVDPDGAWLRVAGADPGGSWIRGGKGINVPDTTLTLPSLTAADVKALDTVVALADAVGYSFVRTATDLDHLFRELDARDGGRLAVLAKIETSDAVQNLPDLLARGPARRPFAIMLARGDLAVEIGWERLSEAQEEIVSLADAAHVPVVWATQVLERMVHEGRPTRAEITDVVAADQAECVMLNKGPFQVEAVALLHELLRRVHPHHAKHARLLPALHLDR